MSDTKPPEPTQPLSVRLRALAAKETAYADSASVLFSLPGNPARNIARAQAFNEAAVMAEEGEATGALAGDVVSGAEYRGVRDRLVAAAIDLANARKERDEAVATAERLQRERDDAVTDAVGYSYAEGAKAERERLEKVFDHSAECADKRATECAGRKDYEYANDNVRAASVWRNAAAECRKVPA